MIMAHRVTYTFKGQSKEIPFSYSQHHNMHEAIAAAEDIDIGNYLTREQELSAITQEKAQLRNFRDVEFAKMGFTDIYFHKNIS